MSTFRFSTKCGAAVRELFEYSLLFISSDVVSKLSERASEARLGLPDEVRAGDSNNLASSFGKSSESASELRFKPGASGPPSSGCMSRLGWD